MDGAPINTEAGGLKAGLVGMYVAVADCKSAGNPDGDNAGLRDGLFWILATTARPPGAVRCCTFPIL
jgi:hypothetical protein